MPPPLRKASGVFVTYTRRTCENERMHFLSGRELGGRVNNRVFPSRACQIKTDVVCCQILGFYSAQPWSHEKPVSNYTDLRFTSLNYTDTKIHEFETRLLKNTAHVKMWHFLMAFVLRCLYFGLSLAWHLILTAS